MRIGPNWKMLARRVWPAMAAVLACNVPAYADGFTKNANSLSAVEWQAVTAQIGSFTDVTNPGLPASDFSATINWGDATLTSATITSNGSGGFDISGTHIYTDELANTTVTTTVSENGNGVFSLLNAPFNVQEAETLVGTPIVFGAGQLFSGQVASFTDLNLNNLPSDFSVVLNWGDGTPLTSGIISGGAGQFFISGNHTYSSAGPFIVTAALKLDGTGDDLVVTSANGGSASVPEPSSLLLLGTGLAGMSAVGLRRKRFA